MLSASNDPQPPFRLCSPSIHSTPRAMALPVPPRIGAVQRTQDRGGVIDVRVVVVAVLEGPAAGTHAGPRSGPVADHIQDCRSAIQSSARRIVRRGPRGARFHQGMAGQRGVPERRETRLDVGEVAVVGHELADGPLGDHQVRMILGVAERI